MEVLPKEKKQKEEKTVLLGQFTVDLLPLVKGERKYKSTLIVHPLPGSPLEGIPPDNPKVGQEEKNMEYITLGHLQRKLQMVELCTISIC